MLTSTPSTAIWPATAITDRDERAAHAISELVRDQHVAVAGDILEVAAHTWAIHGVIPVEGDVILAEFTSRAEARAALAGVPTFEAGVVTPSREAPWGRALGSGVDER